MGTNVSIQNFTLIMFINYFLKNYLFRDSTFLSHDFTTNVLLATKKPGTVKRVSENAP